MTTNAKTQAFIPDTGVCSRRERPEKTDNPIQPSYYGSKGVQPIDIIEDQNLTFNSGNVVKYVARAGKKSKETEIQDLQKAKFYLDREITRLVREKETKAILENPIVDNPNYVYLSSAEDYKKATGKLLGKEIK